MNICSFEFIFFVIFVLLGYIIIPRKYSSLWLLLMSYMFVLTWNIESLIVLLIITGLSFCCGKYFYTEKKRFWLFCVVAIMILLCGKYWSECLHVFYFKAENVLLPIGVSFYTLQAIGYVYNIYKGDELPENNLVNYSLWLAFFPKLISGPIETTENLLEQIKKKNITYGQIERGFYLVIYGYFMKLVIADRLYIFTSYVQETYLQRSSISLFLAAVFYSFQIYCDFAGYSIIAQGVASFMGFDLITNFKCPYLAESISEFWRRWHISLSNWLKQYIYIPLGGNRISKKRTCINLILTFVISGIWHGFGLNYIFWGILHAIYQIAERYKKNMLAKNIRRILTFGMVTLAWIFFSMPSLEKALGYCIHLVSCYSGNAEVIQEIVMCGWKWYELPLVIFFVGVVGVLDLIQEKFTEYDFYRIMSKGNTLMNGIVLAGMILAIFLFGEYGVNSEMGSFIYFQF